MTPPNASLGDAAPPSPENWARVRALVEEALTLPREARPAFLNASCGDDDALRDRVERLVAAYERAGGSWGFLAHPAGELAAPLLVAAVNPVAGTVDHLARLSTALANRYRIERELGAGGMATVYLAHDVRHGRQVAIKVLHPDLSAMLGAERFLSEIKTTAALQHPNILPLFDSGSADGLLFYVMPLVEGETLRARLAREKQLPVPDAVRIASEVAGALDYAHRHGVIHRDIKPENILLHEGRPLVADFGIALAVQSAGTERMTLPGVSLGTPQYMSPEQSLGGQEITARSDVYSLGVVTYEMLTGEPPFTGATVQQILARVHTEEPRAIAAQRKHVTPHAEAAVLTALEKLPADRFESAGEFARALSDPAFRGTAPLGSGSRVPAARWRYTALVVLAVAVLWTVWLRVGDGAGTTQPSAGALGVDAAGSKTIAVLPFENLGPADDDYFAAGMTDEITSRLGAVSGLGVVSRRAAQRYAGSDKTMPEIGREMGTNYLLTGRVRWTGSDSNRVRITLELLSAEDERQLWSTTYDRVIDDIFEVQSDIAGQVIERLGVTLLEGERNRLSAEPTENHEAYTLYLKGRYHWNKRTEENIQIALNYFQQAVDLDPSYSLAWVGIADAWIFRGWYSLLAPRETFPKAKSAALRALQFDSTLSEAHASLAHIHLEFDHDWDAAERGYRRAIELDPKNPIAHQWYGGFLSAMGRHKEALEQAQTARTLDPLSLIIQTWVGLRHYFAVRHDAAIAEYLKALQLDPNFAPAHWHLGWAYEEAGRFADGIAEAERAVAIDDRSLVYLASLGHAYAKAGRKNEARATLARLTEASKNRHVSAYHVAVIHIALGDTNAGLDWLERAYDEQSPWIGYLKVDPRVDRVRSHARFESLLRKARLHF